MTLRIEDRQRDGIEWLFGPADEPPEESEPDPDEDEPLLALLAETDETPEEPDLNVDFEWRDSDFHTETNIETFSTNTRDERIEDYSGDADHGEIRAHVRDRGLADEMQDALEEIGIEEHETTAPEGQLLDMRNVIRRLAGDTTVDDYYRRPTAYPSDDLAVGVSIDMSGSMNAYELEAKAAVGTFLFAVDQLGGTVVANGWQHQGSATKVKMITGSGERFRWRHLDSIWPGGGDPIGRGMQGCGELLRQTTASEKLLFVVSDGKPGVTSLVDHDYDSPIEEAEHVAGELRQRGTTVIGVGFGNVNEENLEAMFGTDWSVYVPLEELADTLADELLDEIVDQEVLIP